MEFILSLHGRSVHYKLASGALSIDGGSGEKKVDLAATSKVRLARLGAISMCELRLRDGGVATISNDDQAKAAEFSRLLVALHAELAALGKPVEYQRGAWLLVSVNAAIGVLAFLFALALQQRWFIPPPALANKATLVMVVGFAWPFLGPLLVWRSRPQSYNPTALPADLVPST